MVLVLTVVVVALVAVYVFVLQVTVTSLQFQVDFASDGGGNSSLYEGGAVVGTPDYVFIGGQFSTTFTVMYPESTNGTLLIASANVSGGFRVVSTSPSLPVPLGQCTVELPTMLCSQEMGVSLQAPWRAGSYSPTLTLVVVT